MNSQLKNLFAAFLMACAMIAPAYYVLATANGSIENTGSGSSGGPTGNEHLADADDEIESLNDRSVTPLTSVAGTDTITASFTPAETTIVTGKAFQFEPANNNTGAVTINLNSMGAVAVKDQAGDALVADDLVAGTLYVIRFDGTNYRVMGGAGGGGVVDYQTFTSSGTWNKPAGMDDEGFSIVECWGGGGGGHSASTGGGGGGGGYVRHQFRGADLGSSETVTIGSGGSAGSAGGNTTFGSLLTAYGGRSGTSSNGGGGGGTSGAGSGTTGGPPDGGDGGSGLGANGTDSLFGGGGGGGNTGGDGADSAYGGGGGGGNTGGLAGSSIFGGDGGTPTSNGSQPGGGGGVNASGGAGQCNVYTTG